VLHGKKASCAALFLLCAPPCTPAVLLSSDVYVPLAGFLLLRVPCSAQYERDRVVRRNQGLHEIFSSMTVQEVGGRVGPWGC